MVKCFQDDTNPPPFIKALAEERVMFKRNRFKRTQSLEDRLKAEAARLQAQAKLTLPGFERQSLLRKARQAVIESRMSAWLTSLGLQAPT